MQHAHIESPSHGIVRWILAALCIVLARPHGATALAGASLAATWLIARQVTSEDVLLLDALGVQLTTHRGIVLGPARVALSSQRTFIPSQHIQQVLLNEGIHRASIIYYLALVVRDGDSTRILIAFPNLLPRLPLILPVWRQLQTSLNDNTRDEADIVREERDKSGNGARQDAAMPQHTVA